MKENNKPKSCDECEYSKDGTCKSFYGGSGCKYNITPIEDE